MAPSHHLNQFLLSPVKSCGIQLSAFSQEMFRICILDMSLKSTNLRLQPHFPEADDLRKYHSIHGIHHFTLSSLCEIQMEYLTIDLVIVIHLGPGTVSTQEHGSAGWQINHKLSIRMDTWGFKWCKGVILNNSQLNILSSIMFLSLLINTLNPGDAYKHHWTGSTPVQVMAWYLFGVKPLPEPMLTYCQ